MRTVLVADDDASVRALVRQILQTEGYDVIEASDGREALGLIREKRPDVALLDVRMPQLDGFGVLQELASHGEGAQRVLLVTGAVEEQDYLRGWGLGADGYISKPFEPDDLIRAVAEVIDLSADELRRRRDKEIERAKLLRQLNRYLDDGRR